MKYRGLFWGVSAALLFALFSIPTNFYEGHAGLAMADESIIFLNVDPFEKGVVSLSFDDGYVSAYLYGVPILDRASFKATFYVITDYAQPTYMTEAQIEDLSRHGHEIGAHTRHHASLPGLDPEKRKSEIQGSYADLVERGLEPETFAYPYGAYNDSVERTVAAAGFASARTIDTHMNDTDTSPYRLGGFSVYSFTPLTEIKSLIDKASESKKWLILVFHRIDEDGNPISITHEKLKDIVDYIENRAIPVVSISEGLQMISQNGR